MFCILPAFKSIVVTMFRATRALLFAKTAVKEVSNTPHTTQQLTSSPLVRPLDRVSHDTDYGISRFSVLSPPRRSPPPPPPPTRPKNSPKSATPLYHRLLNATHYHNSSNGYRDRPSIVRGVSGSTRVDGGSSSIGRAGCGMPSRATGPSLDTSRPLTDTSGRCGVC